jgi:hypothetical protein
MRDVVVIGAGKIGAFVAGLLACRAHALCRQQPRQGAGGLRLGDLPSATYPADHSAAVACAGGVAEGAAVAATF